MLTFFTLLLLMILVPVCTSAQASFGQAQLFNDDWQFVLADDSSAVRLETDTKDWRSLTLPHDWSIEHHASPYLASCTGYLPGGIAWYRKVFRVDDLSKRHYIYFEGVYNRSEVYLNGHLLGKRPNGYISFMYDMTPFLKRGNNILAVRVDHSKFADSRWYTGSGIYRDVYLITSGPVHFAKWGMGWKAVKITGKKALVRVSADVESHLNDVRLITLHSTLTDAQGKVVASSSRKIRTKKGKISTTVDLNIRNPHRWNLQDPYLYTLSNTLKDEKGTVIDKNSCRVGLRTLRFDANKGFALNGKWMKVKGVCLHHDAGVLGSAVPRDVWERRLRNLKAIGANAIRMSHNPQAPCVYDLCDELGFLVMDEGSDEWEFPKRKWIEGWNVGKPGFDGSYDFFEEWIDRDVTDMVRRDRNHPSVFLWSVGNEVDYPNDPYSHPILNGTTINQPMFGGYNPDAPDARRIGVIAKRLAACIKSVDTSRPTTGALAGVVMSNETEYPQAVDVVGYNYTEDRYDMDHAKYPKRIIYGSENGSGFEAWKAVTDRDFIFGQFIWTGTDYLGESGRWPSRGLGTGMLDFASWTKPRGQMRASMWLDKPFTYCGTYPKNNYLSQDAPDDWNYAPGDSIRVVVYTNSPKARLLLNRQEIGELRGKDKRNGIVAWDVVYQPGTLKAEGCDQNGNVNSSYEIVTTGRPYAIKASVDKEAVAGRGVAHVTVEVVDENGNRVKLADNDIQARLEGTGARIIGMENGANDDMSDAKALHRRVHRGRLLVYLQSTGKKGDVKLTLTSPLLQSTSISLKCNGE